jgi:integrase
MPDTDRLSAAKVRKEKRPGMYADGGGLYLQVQARPTEEDPKRVTRSWIFRYRLAGHLSRSGKPLSREMGLGAFDTFSLGEARERARLQRQLLADGKDPIVERELKREAERQAAAKIVPFRQAAEDYIAAHEAGWKNAKHRAQWRSTLSAYVFPKLGARPVLAIDAELIHETLKPIWSSKIDTAKRVKGRVELVIKWFKAGKPQPHPGKAKRRKPQPALAWQHIPAFMTDLRNREGIAAKALEFTILTAARTTATIGAKWSEIDFDAKIWTVPMARDGTKLSRRDHRVPLTDRAIELLKSIPREKNNEHIFPGRKAGTGLSDMAMLKVTREMAWPSTTPGRLSVPHGFRATFKTWCAESTNYPRLVSEMALAHAAGEEEDETEQAYQRGDLLDKRKPLMRDWARYCAKPAAAGQVLPMRKGSAS